MKKIERSTLYLILGIIGVILILKPELNFLAVSSPNECYEYVINWEGKCKQKYNCEPISGQTGFCGKCDFRIVDMSFCSTSSSGTPATGTGGSSTVLPANPEQTPTSSYSSTNTFSLGWIDQPTEALNDASVVMKINVKNTGNNWGAMKVQCSILDPDLPFLQAIEPMVTNNCVAGEYFTETKIVELDQTEQVAVSFTVQAPHNPGTYRLYCAAYERCYAPGIDSETSDELRTDDIKITEGVVTEFECEYTTFWMKLKSQECIDGEIVKKEKEPFDWKEHKLGIAIVLIIIFFVAFYWVYAEKKAPPSFLSPKHPGIIKI